MHPNQVKIDRAYKKRQRESGIVPVRVMVPIEKVGEIKALAEKWRKSSGQQPKE
jgi:hypothetical protein